MPSMRASIFLPLLAVACGGEPAVKTPEPTPVAPRPTISPAAKPVPNMAACLPQTTAASPLVNAEIDGDRATVCYATTDDSTDEGACADVHLASGAVLATRKWRRPTRDEGPAPKASAGTVVTATADAVKICKTPTSCSTIKVQHKPVVAGHGDGSSADKTVLFAVNGDASRVFVFAPELGGGKDPTLTTSWSTYGDTYDVKTGRRLFHRALTTTEHPIFSDPTNSWRASFVGKNVLLDDYVCCGPGGTTMLFDPEKGTVKRLHGYGGSFSWVTGSVYAALDDKTVTFVDVDTLQAVGAPITASGKPLDSPESTSAQVLVGDAKIVLASANPPALVVIDPASKKRTSEITLPLCP